jgi:hypothetical protein
MAIRSIYAPFASRCFGASGFPNKTFLPRRYAQGFQTGQLQFDLLPGGRFKSSGLSFPEAGSPGINLLKIHGALVCDKRWTRLSKIGSFGTRRSRRDSGVAGRKHRIVVQ